MNLCFIITTTFGPPLLIQPQSRRKSESSEACPHQIDVGVSAGDRFVNENEDSDKDDHQVSEDLLPLSYRFGIHHMSSSVNRERAPAVPPTTLRCVTARLALMEGEDDISELPSINYQMCMHCVWPSLILRRNVS